MIILLRIMVSLLCYCVPGNDPFAVFFQSFVVFVKYRLVL